MTRRLIAVSLVVFALLAAWPADALAQRGRVSVRAGIRISPQRTIVYPPWYGPFGYGPYQYPYPYPGPYPYRGYGYDNSAELRIETKPRETEVYVDGARAGIVDDYDGVFQRLHLVPGDHEITLYLAGFRTWSERRYFGPRSNQRILHTMLQLAPGQPDDPRPVPAPVPMERMAPRRLPGDMGDDRMPPPDPRYTPPPDRPQPDRDPRQPVRPSPPIDPRYTPPPDRPQADRPQPDRPQVDRPQPDRPEQGPPATNPRDFGTLSVGIQPADAEITLDGQKQTLPSGQTRLIIQLPEGVHRLVITKAGLSPFETDLQIRRGRTLQFSVNLVK